MNATLGVVLAGGLSSRMGRDKAALPYGGRRLVEHMAELLTKAGVESVVVSGNVPGVRCIPDRTAGLGPLGGLNSVLMNAPSFYTSLLLVPIDMPLLNPSSLRELSKRATNFDAVHFQDCELPAAFRVNAALRESLERLLSSPEKGRRSMRALLEVLHAEAVPAPDAAQLRNANTPRDWEEVQA